jgi:2'-5' RNA ligase
MDELPPIRLFVGTAIGSDVRDRIQLGAKHWSESPTWRTASPDQWHVTSLFIGERDQAELDRITTAVAKIARDQPAFRLSRGMITTMPLNKPSMLWVRFDPSAELTTLHSKLAEATGTLPIPYSPYWPHITLARGNPEEPIHNGPVVLDELLVDRLTLFRSDRGRDGSVHTPLSTWSLG